MELSSKRILRRRRTDFAATEKVFAVNAGTIRMSFLLAEKWTLSRCFGEYCEKHDDCYGYRLFYKNDENFSDIRII